MALLTHVPFAPDLVPRIVQVEHAVGEALGLLGGQLRARGDELLDERLALLAASSGAHEIPRRGCHIS